jgi:hypothetical protein
MTSPKTSPSDINALAAEVMDLWQEHLAIYAADPKAKAELMKLLEPQRQLFADWMAMMQNAPHGASSKTSTGSSSGSGGSAAAVKPHGAAATAASSDDGALRLAQLAHRMAELEKRMAKLESRSSPGIGSVAKTTRRSKAH